MSELMIPSLTGSVTGSKLESWYGDVGQDGLFSHIIVWCNVLVDDPQPNWQRNWLKAWELIWGWRLRLLVYIIVWCYVGVDVTQLNWHKACNESCFGEVDQDDMFILQSNAMSELMSSILTGIKTAECLSGEKAKYFVYSCNKSVCSLPALLALGNVL